MQYLLLIYGDEAKWANMPAAEMNALFAEYRQLMQQLGKSGKLRAGDQLMPTSTARTVRVRDGKRQVTNGPFAETKEQLGGYFLVEAADMDEAVAIAAKIPSAKDGCVEVRAVSLRQES